MWESDRGVELPNRANIFKIKFTEHVQEEVVANTYFVMILVA